MDNKKIAINIRFNPPTYEWLKGKSSELGISMGGYINTLVANAMKAEELQKQIPGIFEKLEEYKGLLDK